MGSKIYYRCFHKILLLVLTGIVLPGNLLQAQDKYFKDDDPRAALILLIGLGSVIALGILISIIRHGMARFQRSRPSNGGMGGSRLPMRQFSSITLHNVAKNYDLNKDQTKILEYVLTRDGVSNPKTLLSNPNNLDIHFKRTYESMRRNIPKTGDDSTAQKQLYQLFSTRNAIESAPINASRANVSQVEDGMDVVLGIHGKTYPLKVIRVKGQLITMLCPINPLGEPIKLTKGTKVELSFFSGSSHGYLQRCQVLDIVKNAHEENLLQLITQGKVKTLFKRKSRRRQVKIPCEFRVVTLTKTGAGPKAPVKMTVGGRKFTGDILDISPGGCSVRTKGLLKPGLRIKIDFEVRGSAASALGQILRINRGSSITSFVHVKFIKASLKALNVINAVVYRYIDD
ncbi:MAG: PilZ domain-containing protein [Treponema sp.]|jgi:hypothetical protein|nr:PilZ domain-containing protein [Treponema sp.]